MKEEFTVEHHRLNISVVTLFFRLQLQHQSSSPFPAALQSFDLKQTERRLVFCSSVWCCSELVVSVGSSLPQFGVLEFR